MLTSRYPRVTGLRSNGIALDHSEVTIAEYLRRKGYRTGAFGKLHLEPQLAAPRPPIRSGSAPYFGFTEFRITEDPKTGEYLDFIDSKHPAYSERVRKSNAEIPVEIHQSAWIADRTIKFLHGRKGSAAPFFALCSFVDPHHPCDPPPPFKAMYRPEDVPAPIRQPNELRDKAPYYSEFAAAWKQGAGGLNSSERCVRNFIAQYYGEISLLDSQVGRVLAALEELGERENTIIAFTSDHGELLGDHGLLYKGAFPYDCLIKTPMILSGAGVQGAGRIVNAITESIDLAPGLLELAGLPVPAAMQGKSLAPLCRGSVQAIREASLTETIDPGGQPFLGQRFRARLETLRTSEWKLSVHQGGQLGELYDLRNDPHEFVNLWGDATYTSKRQQLTAQLLDTLLDTADPLPVRNFDY
jgi:arylsulfatase